MQVTTDRLPLIRVAAEQAADLVILHDRRDVARWYAGRWTEEEAHGWAEQTAQQWRKRRSGQVDGVTHN